jgi:hypothetical protein
MESKKEYDMIYEKTKEYIKLYSFFYKCLKYVNRRIWNIQDDVKKMSIENAGFNELWNKITLLNDVRFRLKNKINISANSDYKEQKGYNEKIKRFKILEANQIENDAKLICCYSIFYDFVHVYVHVNYMDALKKLVYDDKTICVYENDENDENIAIIDDLWDLKHMLEIDEFENFYKSNA